MWAQPEELARIAADPGPAEELAERLRGRRVLLAGIGTSWHAAHHGAWLLREAGVDAGAAHAADLAPYAWQPDREQGVIVLSHTAGTGYSKQVLERAREAGAPTVQVSGVGAPGADLETVAPEKSYAYTSSHTAALLRLAQLAVALGAELGDLGAIPEAVGRVLDAPPPVGEIPDRLIELTGPGPNGWTAQEGALKIREASYVAAEGLSAEQFFHGPSVALDGRDVLVVLDGGGPMQTRTEGIAAAAEVGGARVVRLSEADLGEALSIFPLTVWVQRIALEFSEARGTNPDRFRYDEDPARERSFESLGF
jgi:glucosamine--fructose-6-phosphate aminotransferase (isomerizing)